MDVVLTEQLKLITTENDNTSFRTFTERYASACTDISEKIFSVDPLMPVVSMHDEYYQYVRFSYGLKSQMSESVFKTVHARYKAIDTSMKKETYRIRDDQSGKTYSFQKDVNWLWHPAVFSRPQADLVRGRDWSWRDGMAKLSINTLDKRHVVKYECRPECRVFDPAWKQEVAKLVFHESDKHWYLHISVMKEYPDMDVSDIEKVEGHDRGLANLVTTRTDDGKTIYEPGADTGRIRNRYNNTRASLQSKGTKGAKRVLKRLSERENRMMSCTDHRISKTLVERSGEHTLHVMENLTGISFDEENLKNRTKSGRNELRSWSFYSLETKTAYKASMNKSTLITVDPSYTSQRCPKCGNVSKKARNRDEHEYRCPKCGGVWNDDESASMNLRELGLKYLSGMDNPYITPEGTIMQKEEPKAKTSRKPKTAV